MLRQGSTMADYRRFRRCIRSGSGGRIRSTGLAVEGQDRDESAGHRGLFF